MWWFPWFRSKGSARDNDLLLAALLAGHGSGSDTALGSVEAATALWQDAIAGAQQTAGRPVASHERGLLIREYLLLGEAVRVVEVVNGAPVLLQASLVNVYGTSPYRESWRYHLQVDTPSGAFSREYSAAQVLHWRRNPRAVINWRGRSVLSDAPALAALAGEVERSLCAEHKVPSRRILNLNYPFRLPPQNVKDSGDAFAEQLTQVGMSGSKEGDVVAATTHRGADTPERGAWRLGAEPTAASVELRGQLRGEVASAFGVPPQLLFESSGASQAMRELRGVWARTRVAPILDALALELRRVLDDGDIAFVSPLTRLEDRDSAARETARRAGAAAALVKAGWTQANAARLAGLES